LFRAKLDVRESFAIKAALRASLEETSEINRLPNDGKEAAEGPVRGVEDDLANFLRSNAWACWSI
jgi:hypothetical protein